MAVRPAVPLLVVTLALAAAGEAGEPGVVRYDLAPGDELRYRQRIVREVRGADEAFSTEGEWSTRVVVAAGSGPSRVLAGFARRRERMTLLTCHEGRKDCLERDRPEFDRNWAARPAVEADAASVEATAGRELPVAVTREATGEILPVFSELPPLPPEGAPAVKPGEGLGLEYRRGPWEERDGESCLRVEASSPQARVDLRYWFCPAVGAVRRLEVTATYVAVVNREVTERLEIDLVGRTRGRSLGDWLGEPVTREAALAVLQAGEAPPVEASALHALLTTDDMLVTRLVLSTLYRRHLPAPPASVLAPLLDSPATPLRRLAVRVLDGAPADVAAPLLERALADTDPAVRRAARSHVRRRLGPDTPPTEAAVDEAIGRGLLALAEPEAGPEGPAARFARGVAAGRVAASWDCSALPDWPWLALLAQRRPPERPGATLRTLAPGPPAGHPYVVHVPDDYRGDEPFPVVLALGGGAGRAVATALHGRDLAETLGAIVLFPQAGSGLLVNDSWWAPGPVDAVDALLREALAVFDVDTNRVSVVGSSNGGTGAFLFATMWPHRFSAAVSLMGAGIRLFDSHEPPVAGLRGLPVLLLHGADDPVIARQATEDTAKRLREVGASVEARVLPGRKHDINLVTDRELWLDFLREHVREPFPRRLTVHTDGPYRSRWVEVVAKRKGRAEVEAEIGPGNVVTVRTRRVTRLRLLLRRELLPEEGPLRVVVDGREVFSGPLPEDCRTLLTSWRETGDPFLAHSFALEVEAGR